MKLICKQCGKEFTITDGEKEFYKSKKLALPKRCKNCRNNNKNKRRKFKVVENKDFEEDEIKRLIKEKEVQTSNIDENIPKNKKNSFIIGIATIAVVAVVGLGNLFGANTQNSNDLSKKTAAVSDMSKEQITMLFFRNDKLFYEHYEKHGKEMGFESAEEYLKAANEVVNNPDTLHKYEEEDGDDVYFLEVTGEFVVVSTDGYIRTYYYADKDYFDRQ